MHNFSLSTYLRGEVLVHCGVPFTQLNMAKLMGMTITDRSLLGYE